MFSYLVPILGFIFVFGLVVLIHELGHFVFAKSGDVEVETFSIGMGPALFSYEYGETDYQISMLPLGGYVSMAGEDPEEAGDNPRAFYNKSVGNRMMILLAGCLFNFLLGYVIFVLMGMFIGEPRMSPKVGFISKKVEVPGKQAGQNNNEKEEVTAPAYGKLQIGDRILKINGNKVSKWQDIQVQGQLLGDEKRKLLVKRDGKRIKVSIDPVKIVGEQLNQPRYILGIQPYSPPKVDRLRDGGDAAQLGIEKGDRILKVNDEKINSWEEFTHVLKDNPGQKQLMLGRNDKNITKTINIPEETDEFRQWFSDMGWAPPIKIVEYGFFGSFYYGARRTVEIIQLMYETVVGLATQRISPKSLAGPIGIAQMTGQVSQRGFISILFFTAFFSINLGVLNLLPIPVLDGGHMVMTLPELITGNPLPDRFVSAMNYMGIFLLLTLLVYVTKIDLCRYEIISQYLGSVCQ